MEFIPLELSGSLPDEIRVKYGSGFSFWESLKMGGTGSHKLFFIAGPQPIHDFDNSSIETLQVSFQYLKQALLIRFNVARKIAGWIALYIDVQQISLYKKVASVDTNGKIEYRCDLVLSNKEKLTFRMHGSDRKHFVRFFTNGPLKHQVQIGTNFLPPQ